MIDKKGRIFGKINIIDLVVVILVMCLAGAVIYNVFLKKEEPKVAAPVKDIGTARVTFKIYNAYPEWVNQIKEGDNLIISERLTDMKVQSVSYEKSKSVVTMEDGKTVVSEHPLFVDCTIVASGSGAKDALGITIADTLYRIGDSREVRTSTVASVARVIDVQFEPAQ